jgi:hypothetical protein
LEEELWQWFVDQICGMESRQNSASLLAAAEALKADLLEFHHHMVDAGRADPCQLPRFPALDARWLSRWRKKYGVSFRTVNLRYKISSAKRDARLRICWCNVIRLRVLHQCLFGPGNLRFVGLDQKPLWFNSAHGQKTLALKGAERVAVKENTAASRERFTVLTNCLSWTPTRAARDELRLGLARVDSVVARVDSLRALDDLAPPIGILFRAAGGANSRLRGRLRAPDGTLVQFAAKGSYRLQNMIEFFRWCFGPAAAPRQSLVFVLDWYAVHLEAAIDEELHAMGHAVLRLGGGITPDVQVGDTHRHGPFTKAYRAREIEDARRSQLARPGRMPEASRQTIIDRTAAAWRDLDHSQGRREHVQDGFLNALDGSEDGLLRRDLLPVWHRLEMPAKRARIIAEVQERVRSGDLAEWSHYTRLLEPYDDHPGVREGLEGALVVPEAPDVADDADAGSSEDAPEDVLAEAAAADDSSRALGSHLAPVADGGASVMSILPPDLEGRARESLAQEVSSARLAALSDAAALLRGIDDRMAERIERRMAGLQRRQQALGREAQVWLRSRALQRKDAEAEARAAAAEEDRRSDQVALDLKLARAKGVAARADASAVRAEARRKITELQAEKGRLRKERDADRQRRELLRRNFVAWKLEQAENWFRHPELGPGRRRAVEVALQRSREHLAKLQPAPSPWSEKEREGYLEVTPGSLLPFGKPSKSELAFASEALARRLYGGRHPADAASSRSPVSRATAMLDQCLPGFNMHLPGYMLLPNTLRAFHGNLDLALFEALWRFSHAVRRTSFPHGLLEWPLSPTAMSTFVTAMGREDLVMAAVAGDAVAAAAPAPAPGRASASAGGTSGAPAPTVSKASARAPATAAKAAAAAFAAAMGDVPKAHPPPPPPRRTGALRLDVVPMPKASAKSPVALAKPKAAPKGLAAKWSEPIG